MAENLTSVTDDSFQVVQTLQRKLHWGDCERIYLEALALCRKHTSVELIAAQLEIRAQHMAELGQQEARRLDCWDRYRRGEPGALKPNSASGWNGCLDALDVEEWT